MKSLIPLRYLAALLALCLLTQPVWAQQEDVPSKFYVGAQVGAHLYLVDYSSGSQGVAVSPVHVQVGYQISPRLALQLGVGYRHRESNAGSTTSPIPGYPSTQFETDWWTTDLPLTARYTLSKPTSRLKFDLIGGVVLVQSRYRYSRQVGKDGVVFEREFIDNKATDAYLTAGAGMRYGLSRKLDLTFDAQLNKLPRSVAAPPNTSFVSYFSLGPGLRYTFR